MRFIGSKRRERGTKRRSGAEWSGRRDCSGGGAEWSGEE